jgi:hypothetical protein
MSHHIKRLYQGVVLVFITGFFIVLATANIIVINSTDFSMYNGGWNGCSMFAKETHTIGEFHPTIAYNHSTSTIIQQSFTEHHLSPDSSCLFIIGPQTPFSSEETRYVHEFVSNGGCLFLADDFGKANSLLNGLNTSSRFSNHLLLDLSFEKNATFVALFTFHNHSHILTKDLSGLLLNYPTSLSLSPQATRLASTSQISWLDINENGKQDEIEPQGPFPVLSVEPYGKGEIVLLSAPSILINSMKPYLSNSQFRTNLLTYLLENRPTVIIDEGHRGIPVPFQLGYQMTSDIPLFLKISILLLAVIVFLGMYTPLPNNMMKRVVSIFTPKDEDAGSLSSDQIVEELMKRHPTWNPLRIQTLIERMKYHDRNQTNH